MASMQHEGLLLLFRNRPTLAPELLSEALGLPLPAYSEARVESAELTEVVPTEYRVGETIVRTVLAAVEGLEAERVRLYLDLAMSSLGEAARNALEALMRSDGYEYQSEFFRGLLAEGLQKGLQQGLQQGREEGRQEGLHEGERAALFEVLDARGLEVDDAARQQIMACKDFAQFKVWLRRAVTAKSVQELFENEPAPRGEPR